MVFHKYLANLIFTSNRRVRKYNAVVLKDDHDPNFRINKSGKLNFGELVHKMLIISILIFCLQNQSQKVDGIPQQRAGTMETLRMAPSTTCPKRSSPARECTRNGPTRRSVYGSRRGFRRTCPEPSLLGAATAPEPGLSKASLRQCCSSVCAQTRGEQTEAGMPRLITTSAQNTMCSGGPGGGARGSVRTNIAGGAGAAGGRAGTQPGPASP